MAVDYYALSSFFQARCNEAFSIRASIVAQPSWYRWTAVEPGYRRTLAVASIPNLALAAILRTSLVPSFGSIFFIISSALD